MIAVAVHRVCMDIRLLQSINELREPFDQNQVGSSAMPYKQNPMRSERCCGLARQVMCMPANAAQTASLQVTGVVVVVVVVVVCYMYLYYAMICYGNVCHYYCCCCCCCKHCAMLMLLVAGF